MMTPSLTERRSGDGSGGTLVGHPRYRRTMSSADQATRPSTTPDEVNRQAWSSARVIREFDAGSSMARSTWIDRGEQAAFLWVASRVRGAAALDVGVGGGRTVPLVRLLTDTYVAVDYLPEMVEMCRRSWPEVDVRVGDARNLDQFDTEQFGFVLFSFNGIDAVDHEDRSRVLAELHRVLTPDGLLVFSTHNKSGPTFGATPWRRAGPPEDDSALAIHRLLRSAASLVLNPAYYPRSIRNWRRLRRHATGGPDWAVGPVEAHDFDLLLHFTTLSGQVDELDRAGFDTEAVFAPEGGRRVERGSDMSGIRYFHVVARKRGRTDGHRPHARVSGSSGD
jgi:SAM-dependent methyltransferase